MLTKGDDFPIHQTPEPIAYAGSDRNFYDRYFFNAYAPDGSAFVAVAFGVYPALNVADAHVSIIRGGNIACTPPRSLGWSGWTCPSGRSGSRCSNRSTSSV